METIKIVEGIKNGEKEVWNMIVDRYSKSIYNIALNFSGNSDDAADVTQEIFLKIYNSIDKYVEDKSLTSWIITITRNYCIDFWRKHKKYMYKQELDENTAIDQESPENNIIKRNEIAILKQQILKLQPESRLMLIMRDIQEKSYQEISEELDIPLGTAKSRINRARVKLAKLLLGKGG